MEKKGRGGFELSHVGNLLPGLLKDIKTIKPPSLIETRLVEGAALEMAGETPLQVLYQHTVLCQTCLPFRDPGDETRTWERINGGVHLEVNAGKAMHPEQGRLVPVGLPFGPKARMILMHINQEALRQRSPEIEIQRTLSKFVSRTLKLDSHGRNMRTVKEQLGRLSAASIRFGVVRDGHAITVNSQIVTAFDIWFPKDNRQHVLWPSTIRLSSDYFESLQNHAVPLNEDHIARLSHSALALDVYAWLANRLHRVPKSKPAFIPWAALHSQFGQGYTGASAIKDFRANFRTALKQVCQLYRGAQIADTPEGKPARPVIQQGRAVWREPVATGITLFNSPPPVSKRD